MVRAAQASPDHGFCDLRKYSLLRKNHSTLQRGMLHIQRHGVSARAGDPSCLEMCCTPSRNNKRHAAPRDALECVAALARTREDRQNCVRFAYL